MKLRLLSFFAVFASAAAVACATAPTTQVIGGPLPDGTDPDAGGTSTPADDDDVANQPPHSLGTIVLGESHGSGTSKSTPLVSAAFYPDALLTRSCTTKIGSDCTIQKAPKCTSVSTTTTGCNSNEACTMDNTTCTATCKPFAVCETPCQSDEVCKPTGTGTTATAGTCVKTESFDAGPLAFSGTTTEITMFPPYAFESTGQGAPFLGGAQLHVQASGAAEAGFEKFDEMFTATTFIQTSPSLSKIPRALVFGSGTVPVSWAPANDQIVITVSGLGGSAVCKVSDAAGKYDIPRSVIVAAQGDQTATTSSSGTVSISVARQHRDVKKDQHAKGTLLQTPVKPDGWLELVTLSSESYSFQGCAAGQAICPSTGTGTGTSADACVDVTYDRNNCGACGKVCTSTQSCENGSCTGGSSTGTCTTCRSNAESGSCASYYSTCQSNVSCDDLAYCASTCTTAACVSSCESQYSAGYTQWSPLKSCLTSYCSSTCGF